MEVNLLAVIVLALLVIKIIDGYKKGMVKEVISFISLIFLCLVAALIGNGIKNYLKREFLAVAVIAFLLTILGIAHHLINLLVLPAKLLAKLPVIHSVDKLLGTVVGALETVLLLWTLYTFIMIFDTGMFGQFVLQSAAENPVLTWLYENNRLAVWIQTFGAELTEKWL